MMALRQTQRRFMDYLLAAQTDAASPSTAPIHAEILDGGRVSVERRLHIYHHAYRARLVEVMQDVFERTWAYLGDNGFEQAAHGFIEQHPSSQKTLNRYGEQFPAYLAQTFEDDPDIAEVATVDWMVRCAFDGADAAPITPAALASLVPEDWAVVGFTFHPTTAVTPIGYNAASIWEALENTLPPPPATRLPQETSLVVWRREFRPHFLTIDATEAAAIAALQTGASFAETCDRLATMYPDADVATMAGVWLRRWLADDMLIAVRLP
jgi:hypothetical protein